HHQFKYDVVLSFAKPERELAEELARLLTSSGVRVFYDYDNQADLWGRNLYQHLQEVYRDQSRYCVPFLSAAYAAKAWTNHELEQAQARAFSSNMPYILPIRVDDTPIPGINPTTAFVDLRQKTLSEVATLICTKLFGSME